MPGCRVGPAEEIEQVISFVAESLQNPHMRILFDHNTPLPLRYSLRDHTVETTAECGWDRLKNGELLDAAEEEGFEILLTADKGFQGSMPTILDALAAAQRGTCTLAECRAW